MPLNIYAFITLGLSLSAFSSQNYMLVKTETNNLFAIHANGGLFRSVDCGDIVVKELSDCQGESVDLSKEQLKTELLEAIKTSELQIGKDYKQYLKAPESYNKKLAEYETELVELGKKQEKIQALISEYGENDKSSNDLKTVLTEIKIITRMRNVYGQHVYSRPKAHTLANNIIENLEDLVESQKLLDTKLESMSEQERQSHQILSNYFLKESSLANKIEFKKLNQFTRFELPEDIDYNTIKIRFTGPQKVLLSPLNKPISDFSLAVYKGRLKGEFEVFRDSFYKGTYNPMRLISDMKYFNIQDNSYIESTLKRDKKTTYQLAIGLRNGSIALRCLENGWKEESSFKYTTLSAKDLSGREIVVEKSI